MLVILFFKNNFLQIIECLKFKIVQYNATHRKKENNCTIFTSCQISYINFSIIQSPSIPGLDKVDKL